MKRLLPVLLAALMLALLQAPPAVAGPRADQARLNDLGCNAGPVDGVVGARTRSAILRFQSRHGWRQTGSLTRGQRSRLHATTARRCDRRPVPARSGTGRRIVLSQGQNWIWLVGPRGRVLAQGGIIDNPRVLAKGSYATRSYCGRAARIRWNTTATGSVHMQNFVRFAPCGIGFHRIPTWSVRGAQIHPNWYLGTNLDASHGCIRVTRAMSFRIWDFTATRRTPVRVV